MRTAISSICFLWDDGHGRKLAIPHLFESLRKKVRGCCTFMWESKEPSWELWDRLLAVPSPSLRLILSSGKLDLLQSYLFWRKPQSFEAWRHLGGRKAGFLVACYMKPAVHTPSISEIIGTLKIKRTLWVNTACSYGGSNENKENTGWTWRSYIVVLPGRRVNWKQRCTDWKS